MRSTEFAPGVPPQPRDRVRDAGDGVLVVASQTCDLARNPASDPEVECLRAFWTSKERIIRPAASNSGRHFLLRERVDPDGKKEGLIADATARVLVTKESLLQFAPDQGCANAQTERRFREWLGRRFSRIAIPTAHVEAIQRPIVEALKLEDGDESILPLLRGVKEVLFAVGNDAVPFQVHLLFLAEEGLTDDEALSAADSERLGAWFGEALAAAGEAELHDWELVDTGSLSLRDYLAFTPLPLDEYSLEG
ncbi:hypothetical protein [Anaeromyxobacter dehalogenans]|uniref:hypothetical protein n=1 Tax=Anaeromyxobacter dehalogenans TaxID=161493 RepID=UPI00143CB5CA|nr:hypothetical protein [Anaeromyxobacter dehalogenans]